MACMVNLFHKIYARIIWNGLGYGLGQWNEITEFAGICIFIPCFALTILITWIVSWECFDNDHGFWIFWTFAILLGFNAMRLPF